MSAARATPSWQRSRSRWPPGAATWTRSIWPTVPRASWWPSTGRRRSARRNCSARPKPSRGALGRDELRDVSARLRAQGKRIVTLNGSFDVMHTGHLHILKEAKRQGDVLIVGVNSDASVRSYKGPGRPINSEQQRAEMLLANRYVDYVHVFDETVPMAFIEAARP